LSKNLIYITYFRFICKFVYNLTARTYM
jgi:hypothetical protein